MAHKAASLFYLGDEYFMTAICYLVTKLLEKSSYWKIHL